MRAAVMGLQGVTLFLLSGVHDLIATSVVLLCCGGGAAVILPCLTRKPALRAAQRPAQLAKPFHTGAFDAFDTAPATGEFR